MLPKPPLVPSLLALASLFMVAVVAASCGSNSPAAAQPPSADSTAGAGSGGTDSSGTPAPSQAGGLRLSDTTNLSILPFARYTQAIEDYLATRQPQWGAALLLPVEGVVYETNGRQQFPLASLTKVLIMATLLDQVAAAGRDLTLEEDELLWAMITVSDNEAADSLWDWVGGSDGVASFLRAHDLSGIVTPADGLSWGDTTASALGIGQFLGKLWAGSLLSEGHREYALELLNGVDPEQRWGTPLAFGSGHAVAVKNGWYPGLTGWRVGSAALELDPESPRILVVLTRNQPDMEYAVETIEGVARIVAETAEGIAPADARVLEHPRETLQVLFQPSAVGLAAASGTCEPSPIVRRAGSWRCDVAGATFDFCFSSPAPAAAIVCGALPGSAGSFTVPLLADPAADGRVPRASPWLFELESGLLCTTVRTELLNEDGDRVTYECSDGTVLVGPIQRSASFYALHADGDLLSLETVRIIRAWF